MSSYFLMKRMENYQGDLADVIRATGTTTTNSPSAAADWQLPANPFGFYPDPSEDFGDPFNTLRDPLLHDIDTPMEGPLIFPSSNIVRGGVDDAGDGGGFGGDSNPSDLTHQKVLHHDDIIKRPPPNIFSRMLQISPLPPCESPAAMPVAAASQRELLNVMPPMLERALIAPNSSKSCLLGGESQGLQISSPRNTGIKRRKSQAKKVVCIPAPAPANSRASGEVVPSDLWAWRKYGQKPIKGSPYPRGYYRCSSSKGCSARKQVERSRTDPNMLVITYTSEHNHPWPTQRNALAGSTRSQPTKTTAATASKNPSNPQKSTTNPKQEHKETGDKAEHPDPTLSTGSPTFVKEEEMDQDFDKHPIEMDDGDQFEERFPQMYKPTLPESSHSEDSFFAELGEIEADPLHLLFSQGFSGEDGRECKSLDPFSFYDWPGNNVGGGGATSHGEAKNNRDTNDPSS